MLCDEGWQRWALGLSPSLQAARRVSQELGLLAAFSWAGTLGEGHRGQTLFVFPLNLMELVFSSRPLLQTALAF